jgi:hypothetical protein
MRAAVLTFTVPTMPGLTFEARPLSSPPPLGAIVFLYGSHRLVAIAQYQGADVWKVVHERFPGVEPTHWAKAL